MKQLWSVVLVVLLTLVYAQAEAARLGGGRSIGRQSANVTQREAVRAPAKAPNAAQNSANAAKPAAAPGAGNAAPRKPWAGMLGGLAAGLGLAWLASALGLGAEFGQFLLIALLVLVGVAVLRMLMRPKAGAGAGASPLAFQGAGADAAARMPGQYNPAKVGNDASARPWEDPRMALDAAPAAGGGVAIGSALAGSQDWGVPEGFDVHGFLEAAKRNFTTLQSAWDRSDFVTLRSMMTDGMLEQVRAELQEREAQRGGREPNQTDVLMLEAKLLGIEELDGEYLASVEFSGVIREDPSAGPGPFREVWNMTKPKDGRSGWLVAGLQALQ
ncbi:Tim44 domain-containing protein [Comamonas flocculans]|uniref:Tim44 domain-containing protein n=1 Tax=Comamonas flocculans TaxID=2597701 RepID=A0A5B8RZB2_9BURK|nr:Tim44-like domain-containing protein [Comamonas flocculans]QEA14062.1 Tim44 domain-containing protein [Comamonas flocculans]